GTLQIGAGGTVGSIAGNILNNAALIFNRSNALTYAGVISGTGTLTKLGAGVLTLTGNHTFSGDTTISAGTLSIGSGGTTGSIVGNIIDNSALIFNRSDNLTYAGVISGSGTLTKQGSGVLSLTGTNLYTG
ncbi:autotransporter-associated beta strand repeat-containing protein, partial [Legionella pneumophila]